jgi:hypothetical protein
MITPARTREAALLAAALAIAACLVPHAVPVFTQDWAWPLTRGQGWQMAHVATNVWRDSGFGSPWTAPNSWSIGVAIGVACAWLGPYVTLVAFLTATIALATFGTATLLRACGVGAFGQVAGAIVYAASPVFMNKVHAGHIYYLVGFACMPLACAFLIRSAAGARGEAFVGGLLLALGAGQFQFFEITIVALALVGFSIAGVAAIRPFAIAVATGLAYHATDYAVMASAAKNVLFFPELPTPQFENALSTPLVSAFSALAYIAGYATAGFGSAASTVEIAIDTLLVAGLALAMFAALSNRPGPQIRAVLAGAALTIVGAFATAGYDGPFAGPLEWLFANVPLATAFREFYHQAALLALGTALVAGIAADAPSRIGRLAGSVPAALLASIFLVAMVRDPLAASGSFDTGLAASVSSVPGRTVYVPGSASLGEAGAQTLGTDSFAVSSGRARSVTYSSDPIRAAYWFGPGAASIGRVAARFGWTAVVERPGVVDRYVAMLDPETRSRLGTFPVAAAMTDRSLGQAGFDGDLRAVVSTSDVVDGVPTWPAIERLPPERHLLSPVPETAPPFQLARLNADPARGMAQSERFLPAVRSLSCLPMPTFFRFRHATGLGTTACSWHYEQLAGRSCLSIDTAELAARGPCTSVARGPTFTRSLAAKIRRHELMLYFIRQAYDRDWRLACVGAAYAPNVLVDGYAAGFATPTCRNPRATYGPDRTFHRVALGSTLALGLILAFDLHARNGVARRRRPKPRRGRDRRVT